MAKVKKLEDFISPYKQMRLVIEPSFPKTQFHPGSTGKSIQFNNGSYTPKNQEEVDFLLSHNGFGVKFFRADSSAKKIADLPEELIDVLKDYDKKDAEALLKKIKENDKKEDVKKEKEVTHVSVASTKRPSKYKSKKKVIE